MSLKERKKIHMATKGGKYFVEYGLKNYVIFFNTRKWHV